MRIATNPQISKTVKAFLSTIAFTSPAIQCSGPLTQRPLHLSSIQGPVRQQEAMSLTLNAIRIAAAAAGHHRIPHGFYGRRSARCLDLCRLALCLYG
jgi:hypothetical protein